LEALVAGEPIHRRQVHKARVAERPARAVDGDNQLGKSDADRGDAVRRNTGRLRGEPLQGLDRHQPAECPLCGMLTPGAVWAPCRALRLSAAIRSLSLMSESSSASGVGGQPGTYTSTGTILSTPWMSA